MFLAVQILESRPVRRRWLSPADAFTVVRIPLAIAFVAVPAMEWRLAILVAAGASDFADGFVARRLGGSRLGSFLDPVADKFFMACAFTVVLLEHALTPLEVLGVLARDLAAALAFVITLVLRRPAAIPARLGGKAVTIGQLLTLLAFVLSSLFLRPLAWATAAVALYAIWDYVRAAPQQRALGE
ncbi:MAG TPA: CDP-alcohol phosphatidyltransferase family protein [Gemmatimonadales bacterium]|jgi:phosphatidylglycerophosphate synthase|nr:CDP-alcohol phosphatidyltransferase family protein [Gemmatimonadales bacterium]